MSRFIRKVKTAGGATAVQIITKRGRERVGLRHIDSAHTEAELQLLINQAQDMINDGQLPLFNEEKQNIFVERASACFIFDTLVFVYERLGFDCIEDTVFQQLVYARVIEPASKLDTVRILQNLGINFPSSDSLYRSLRRCIKEDYRSKLTQASLALARPDSFSLVLYDVTTLYFETMQEDEYKKLGYSK